MGTWRGKFSHFFIAWRVGQSDWIQISYRNRYIRQNSQSLFRFSACMPWPGFRLHWGPVAVHFRRRDGIPNARVHFHPVQNSDAHLLPARLTATFISWTLLLHRKLRGMVAPPENAIKPQLHSKKEPLQLPLPGDVIAESKVSTPAIELKVK